MKRMLLMAGTSSVLALAAPGVASAQHGKRHHGASAHKRHARRARVLRFGSVFVPPASAPNQTSVGSSTPSGETAGTVKSFDTEKGVLTITLGDGSTVSGLVDEQTELECTSATPQASTADDDQGGGDDVNGGESGENGGSSVQAHDSSVQSEGDDGTAGSQPSCTTAALVQNAVVGEAELKLSSAGAVWEKVELLQ
jgi:cold shock CspA family protein